MKDNSFEFALDIIGVYKYLQEQRKEFVMSKQLLRSGTAVGALIRESEYAESKADFVHKMAISLKEANETEYWIELLYRANYIEKDSFMNMSGKLKEILKLLTAIINTTKKRMK